MHIEYKGLPLVEKIKGLLKQATFPKKGCLTFSCYTISGKIRKFT